MMQRRRRDCCFVSTLQPVCRIGMNVHVDNHVDMGPMRRLAGSSGDRVG